MHTITIHRFTPTDRRLNRHVYHDSRNWNYRFDTRGMAVQSVSHVRHIPVLDQGQVGSCTGNAGVGCLGTDPFPPETQLRLWHPWTPPGFGYAGIYTRDEAGALRLYSDAETIDGDGPYPPNDNGSSGQSVAKALVNAGEIPGYQHTFGLNDALRALTKLPLITGISWFNDMFTPDSNGLVRPTGALAGGHEIVVDSYDADRGIVGFTNSWGLSWGKAGRFFMQAEDYGRLLDQQGDVTVLLPLSAPVPPPQPPNPTPIPTPTPTPDAVFADVLRPWVAKRHFGTNRRVSDAAKVWLSHQPFGINWSLWSNW